MGAGAGCPVIVQAAGRRDFLADDIIPYLEDIHIRVPGMVHEFGRVTVLLQQQGERRVVLDLIIVPGKAFRLRPSLF